MRFPRLSKSAFVTGLLMACLTLSSCGTLRKWQEERTQRRLAREQQKMEEWARKPQKPQTAREAQTPLKPKKPSWYSKLRSKLFPKSKKPQKALQPIWMGTIALVNTDHHFALIDSNTLYAAVPGMELIALSKERETARLRISPDKNPPFFIADILSGAPQVGNRVYSPDHPENQ